jgi:2-dehydropantoate 2-reductase
MRIAVVGSGGVGGFFGGLLAQAGHDVAFVARGAHLRAIRSRGLKIERAGGGFTIAPANATDDPTDIGPVDLALLCVKTYDLPEALAQMRALVGPRTSVLTLQNGVEAPDMAAAIFGAQAVLPGLVYCEVAVKEPGVIFQGSGLQRIVLGEFDGTRTSRASVIAAAFADAGAEMTLSENVLGALWSKFCFICAMGGCTTLARRSLGAVLADDEGHRLLQIVMTEVRMVGEAKGVHFDADPIAAGMATAARFPFETKSSMQRDLERGARLEIEALNGAAVRLGRALGVATPANQAIYAALRLAQPSIK